MASLFYREDVFCCQEKRARSRAPFSARSPLVHGPLWSPLRVVGPFERTVAVRGGPRSRLRVSEMTPTNPRSLLVSSVWWGARSAPTAELSAGAPNAAKIGMVL